jgi:transcriptional regulator with XRE-family HTH domain
MYLKGKKQVENSIELYDTRGIISPVSRGGSTWNLREVMARKKASFRPPAWRPRVEARMKELKLNQIDLARALGVTTRGAIGHYFCGRRAMTAEQLQALARVLKWSVSQLLGEDTDLPCTRLEYIGVVLSSDELDVVLQIYRPVPDAAKPLIRRAFASLAREISAEHK